MYAGDYQSFEESVASIFKEVFGEILFLPHGKRHRIISPLPGSCYILFYFRKLKVDFPSMFRVEILGLTHSVCRNFRS